MSGKRDTDLNGFRTYRNCKFFCECVSQYLGSEIDQDGKLGLKPKGIYNVYRPKSAVTEKSFVASLNAKPLLDDHHVIGTFDGAKDPDRQKTDGVLTEVEVCGNELRGRIDIWSPELLRKIDGGKRELSLAYGCDFIPRKGVFNGEHYDFVQTNLRCGNHLALVDVARNGHDCRVQDGMIVRDEKLKLEKPEMEWDKISADELIEGLKGCSDEVKAKAKEFLNTPTPEEKEAADKAAKEAAEKEAKEKAEKEAADKAKAEEEAAQKAADEAKAKEEAEKKAAEDTAKACDAAIREYKSMTALAADCSPVFGTVSTDGIKTEKELAVKVCALDAAPKFLKDCKPEGAVAALRGYLAGCGNGKAKTTIVGDANPSGKKSFADYMATR